MKSGKNTFIEQAHEIAEDVRSATTDALNDAKEKAGPALAETRDKAGPLLAEAREKAAPIVAEAREKAAPIMAEAKERAVEAREAGVAKVAELRGEEPEPKTGSWVKRLLIVTGLAGVAALIYKKTQGKQEVNWQSSYQPTPAASPTSAAPAAPAPGVGVDAAEDAEKTDTAAEAVDDVTEQKPEGHAG